MGPRPFRFLARKPKLREEYLRFVCFQLVEGRRHRLGLFQALDLARESELAEAWALTAIDDLYAWFKEHLEVPPGWVWRRPEARHPLCWFKPAALEHVRRMFDLKTALEHCGLHVDVLRTHAPGRVLFEDEHQIAAIPDGRTF